MKRLLERIDREILAAGGKRSRSRAVVIDRFFRTRDHVTIEELTRAFFGGTGRGTDTIIYAALIIAIAVFYPSGLIGWWRGWSGKRRARKDAAARDPQEVLR